MPKSGNIELVGGGGGEGITSVGSRETRESWSRLIFETEANGTQGVLMKGVLPRGWFAGLIKSVQEIVVLCWLL